MSVSTAVDNLDQGEEDADRALHLLVEQAPPQLAALLGAALVARPHRKGLLDQLVSCTRLPFAEEVRLALSIASTLEPAWQKEGAYPSLNNSAPNP